MSACSRTRLIAIFLLLVTGLLHGGGVAAGDRITVVAALQPTYSIASVLAEGTSIEVVAVPEGRTGIASLARKLARLDPADEMKLEEADAVVTIGSVWPQDPLFAEARARNVWAIEIDATASQRPEADRVAILEAPVSDAPWRKAGRSTNPVPTVSPYVWFSPANGIRMAEIVASDFRRMAPGDVDRIDQNLADLIRELSLLKAEYEEKFLAVHDLSIYALTDRFAYLTNDFGFFVHGYFIEQDVRWTEDDLAGFTALLADRGISRVIHHWTPSESIRAAAARAGAEIIVLRNGDGGDSGERMEPDGYFKLLRANLEELYRAMAG